MSHCCLWPEPVHNHCAALVVVDMRLKRASGAYRIQQIVGVAAIAPDKQVVRLAGAEAAVKPCAFADRRRGIACARTGRFKADPDPCCPR